MRSLRTRFFFTISSAFVMVFVCGMTVRAQDAPQPADAQFNSTERVIRLSDVEGDAQFQRPGEDWVLAEFNLPLEQGFKLRTQDGRAEVQFESGAVLRLAQNSTVEFTRLAYVNGNRVTQVTLETGTAMISTDLNHDDTFELLTPSLRVNVPHQGGGRFRVDVTDQASWVTVLLGEVEISSGGSTTKLSSGHMLQLNASNPDQFSVDASPEPDDFDKWSVDRDRELAAGYAAEMPYLNAYQPEIYSYGVQDLSSYGHWVACSHVGGMCWQPYGVPARWTPFSDGCWQFSGGLGWTWVSAERWGWLPYHFGRWVFEPRIGWAWFPGPFKHFHPGDVRWLSAENKIAWTPAAAPAGAGAVITGTQIRGVIRTHEHFDGRSAVATNAVFAAAPPAHVAPLADAGPPAHAATPRALRVTSAPGIVFDNSTRTYINSPAQPVSPDVENPQRQNEMENRREQWRVENLSRAPSPHVNAPAPQAAAVMASPAATPSVAPAAPPAVRPVPVEPQYLRARPAPAPIVGSPQSAVPPHQVPMAPQRFAAPPQQHFSPPVQAPQNFSPPAVQVPHVGAPPVMATPHVSPPAVVATPHVSAPPATPAPHAGGVAAPAPAGPPHSGAGAPHH